MTDSPSDALVIFPGALGDFVCFLPTLLKIYDRHRSVSLVAKTSLPPLLDLQRLRSISIDRREIADLYADGEVMEETRALLGNHGVTYTWSGWGTPHVATRLAIATGGTVRSFPFRGMHDGEHAVDSYMRCLDDDPRPVTASRFHRGSQPTFKADRRWIWRSDSMWLADLRSRHDLTDRPYIIVHVGSGSPLKNWTGFAALVEIWPRSRRESLVVVRGPVEVEREVACPGAVTVTTPTLPQLVSLLRGANAYLGNDSGVSHLAAAVGARCVVLFGPTDPATWAPLGDVQVLHSTDPCARCPDSTLCVHRLPVDQVLVALTAQADRYAEEAPATR